MVGRPPVASPLLLWMIAALAASLPALAEPEPLQALASHPALLASESSATAVPAAAATAFARIAPAASSVPAADLASPADPVLVNDAHAGVDADADADTVDPTETLGVGPATAAAAASAAPVQAVLRGPATESEEVGVEYALSMRDASSFIDRLSTRFKHLVEQAMTYLGTPYRRGGTSRNGLDCSGLVGAVYGEQGLELPRTAAEQFGEGTPVAEADLRPGDLVFFRDTYKRGISHVGIYIGDGRFLHAAGHRHGVIVSELSRPYYHIRYAGARRPAGEPGGAERQAANGAPTARMANGAIGASDRSAEPTPGSILAAAPR